MACRYSIICTLHIYHFLVDKVIRLSFKETNYIKSAPPPLGLNEPVGIEMKTRVLCIPMGDMKLERERENETWEGLYKRERELWRLGYREI